MNSKDNDKFKRPMDMDPEETLHMVSKGIKRAFKKTVKMMDNVEEKIKIKIKRGDDQ